MYRLFILFCLFIQILTVPSYGYYFTIDKFKISIIPKPGKIILKEGNFKLDSTSKIYIPKGNVEVKWIAEYFAGIIRYSTGWNLQINEQGKKIKTSNSIILGIDKTEDSLGSSYFLQITKKNILIKATDPSGVFYAIQTLRQILPEEIERKQYIGDVKLIIPCLEIQDRPAFGWRGLMLDCSRTFLPKEFILRYIDLLAFYKMNVLHLHLTDDQGWRLEIKKYPKLTEICSKFDPKYSGEVSGYYTQKDMKEIIDFAKDRYITIVPEIEMPGHSCEIFAAYPEFSCTGKLQEIYPFFKGPTITDDILCAGNDNTFRFIEDVLSEVIDLFPSEYIHIGGDEAPKLRWKQCPKCQTRIKDETLKDENELQSYFIKRIEKFVNSKGRKIIGWDEILEGGLAQNAAVMSWRGTEGGKEATNLGHNVVMSPTTHCYFDYDYKTISLEKAYSFNPIPKELNTEQSKLILGGQANMWTHIARSDSAIDSQIFPRLIMLSEALWIEEGNKDFKDVEQRLISHKKRLKYMGVNLKSE